jgi:hypothetical protein
MSTVSHCDEVFCLGDVDSIASFEKGVSTNSLVFRHLTSIAALNATDMRWQAYGDRISQLLIRSIYGICCAVGSLSTLIQESKTQANAAIGNDGLTIQNATKLFTR